jgi:beta-glucosidase
MVDVLAMRDGVELWKAQVRMLLGSKCGSKSPRFSGNRFSYKYYFGLCQTFCRVWLCRIRKDYNTVDGETTLQNTIFPPFKAAVDAG